MDIQERVGAYWSKRAAETSKFRVEELAGPGRKVWLKFIQENLPDIDPEDITGQVSPNFISAACLSSLRVQPTTAI